MLLFIACCRRSCWCQNDAEAVTLPVQMAGQNQQLLPGGFPGSAPMNGIGGLPGGLGGGGGGLPAGVGASPSAFTSVEAQAAYQAAYQVSMLAGYSMSAADQNGHAYAQCVV